MALDPQAKAFLDRIASFNAPDISEAGAFRARSFSHGEPDLSGPLDPTVRIDHRFFTSTTADTYIKVYTPAGAGPFNGLVYFHGGGWVVNYVGKYDAQCAALAAMTNSVVVSINYQKAPEHKFPIPFNDCYEGLQWVIANAEELNINSAKIGVGGDSAGGNLASAVALAARDRGIKLAYQLLIYPCNGPQYVDTADVPNADGYGLTQRGMKWLWEQYLNGAADRNNPYAVPHSADDYSGLAPAVMFTAEYDVLRQDGIDYSEKLKAAGVSVAYQDCPGMIHGFFNYGKYIDEGINIRKWVAAEINKVLGA
jgi:acetyl esterase